MRTEDEGLTNLEVATKCFAEVKRGLEVNRSLGWALSVDTLKVCLLVMDAPETIRFMDEFLLKMVSILLSQSPSKLGQFERKCIDDSVSLALSIVLRLLPGNTRYLPALVKIFDGSCNYYSGSKISWNYYPGFPQVRLQMARKFAENDGFALLLEVLKSPDSQWMGAETMFLLLKAMSDVMAAVDDRTREQMVAVTTRAMLALTDEQIKRENTDSLSGLVRVIGQLIEGNASVGGRQDLSTASAVFHSFWLDYTYKVISSGSLVLKLFAWEQVHDLMRAAIVTRPPARSYRVRGAGNEIVNGLYEFACRHDDANVYEKAPTLPGMPLLTLFRCTMRTKSKWWFISQADKDKPGTDKDIDYYQHKSIGDEEREPQCHGWVCSSTAPNAPGKEPPPTLQRVGNLLPPGTTEDMFLAWRLPRWCIEIKILESVFAQSPHREIISRCAKLVCFLAEADVLTDSHVRMIWKAAAQSHENDIVDEIFAVLVMSSSSLREDLFSLVISLALEALAHEGPSMFAKVALLAEKFAHDLFRETVSSLSEASASKLLALVWAIYKSPGFEGLKNCVVIQELLSRCLSLKGGATMALQRIQECTRTLQSFASEPVLESGIQQEEREADITRIILTLQFLISKHTGQASIESLDQTGFSSAIITELHRFISANRQHSTGNKDKWYTTQLASRLQVLRQFYGITNHLKMPLKTLELLWGMLQAVPCELDEFFSFLMKGAISQPPLEAIIPFLDCLRAFNTFVCSPDIDWSAAGDASFSCFSRFFNGLEKPSPEVPLGTPLPPRLGLETLWKIVLNIPSAISTKTATELLLTAYDTIALDTTAAHEQLLMRVFSELSEAQKGSDDDKPDLKTLTRVSRCIGVLYGAINRSKGRTGLAHAVRGCMSRIRITVFHRRVTSFFNHSTQQEVVRVDKGSEGVLHLEVHPLQSIFDLKVKICEKIGLAPVSRLSIEKSGKTTWKDNIRLSALRLVDGSEVIANFTVTYGKTAFDEANVHASGGNAANFISDSSSPNIGYMVSKDSSQFNTLLSLCEVVDDTEVSKKLWELLMLIPTQEELLSSVEQMCLEFDPIGETGGDAAKWEQLLGSATSTSCARMTYLLQIIDNILQPAPELRNEETVTHAVRFRSAFIASGGFSAVLKVLVATPSSGRDINRDALASALHIIHFLLFGDRTKKREEVKSTDEAGSVAEIEAAPVSVPETSSSIIADLFPEVSKALLAEIQRFSGVVAEKLLAVASDAAEVEGSGVVSNALQTITFLIASSSEVSLQLVGNPQSRSLLNKVLRSGSKTVREMAGDFAIQVGRSQPVVFSWLLAELESLDPSDDLCGDIFRALGTLLQDLSAVSGAINLAELAQLLGHRLMSYPREQLAGRDERLVLAGYLDLLEKLIKIDPSLVASTAFGDNLVNIFLSEFLFTMPTEQEQDRTSICDTPGTRQAAFNVLSAYLALSREPFEEVLREVSALSNSAANQVKSCWGLQVSHDVKRADISFSGLKNQGCTCYMNSLLQQLFMNVSFREAILSTKLKECHRNSVWHRTPEELVGLDLLFEWTGGCWRKGTVKEYDASTSWHAVAYDDAESAGAEYATFNVHEGRYGKETGKVRVAPTEESVDPISERDDAAYRVLEQLQRTFCFMQFSKRRYFDPRPFVEACKTLNLNFNVYHQNDASEFCDQLLDRIEMATRGKHTKQDVWSDVIQRKIFGGKSLYQKIPQDCEAYKTDKRECGHWQSSRLESFLKLELIIRGKEKIDDSLAEMVMGEMMDGDNKIHCDVCHEKKATVRRTCIGRLPNTMILHLKRFDLDFTTFETVKLNNRMAFATRLNMLKYTKEGIEDEERKAAANAPQSGKDEAQPLSYDEGEYVSPDPDDYEYELQGVLVHAGIAQGGHYYSYVKDSATADKWFRFDDEDVSPFNPDHIPTQCFGGPPMNAAGVANTIEEDRTANALMLFFKKVKPIEHPPDESLAPAVEVPAESGKSTSQSSLIAVNNAPGSVLVDGYEAFGREVRESNLQHVLSCYLLDSDLHAFVRGLIASISNAFKAEKNVPVPPLSPSLSASPAVPFRWSISQSKGDDEDLAMHAVQFGVTFLLDVVLHCRERSAIRGWTNVLRDAFETFPHTARWFLRALVSPLVSWLKEFLFYSSDPLARGTFVQIVVQAVVAIAPTESDALAKFLAMNDKELQEELYATADPAPPVILTLLVHAVTDYILEAPRYPRIADELFMLVRDLAVIPCVCQALLAEGTVSRLAYFAMPDGVPANVKALFVSKVVTRQPTKNEFYVLLQSVFEAVAALLGVPQLRKVSLLQDRTYWESELVPEAREALTSIFNEMSVNGGMDAHSMSAYMERVNGPGAKVTPQQVRTVLERFQTNADGRLSLEGFLQYHTDLAWNIPKNVWRDLHAFGFRNDLSRGDSLAEEDSSEKSPVPLSDLPLPQDCRMCLCSLALYEEGLEASEASARAIARRVCLGNHDMSLYLIRQALQKLSRVANDSAWSHVLANLLDFLKLVLSVEDDLSPLRVRSVLLDQHVGLVTIAVNERARPSNCRANEYDRTGLLTRYVGFVQELVGLPSILQAVTALALEDPRVKLVKGMLRLTPGSLLTENDEMMLRNAKAIVEGAGVPEVNGVYDFVSVKCNAGYYAKKSTFEGADVTFTLYKCSVNNGGYQWFISITPPGNEPGTTKDVDFYYAFCKPEIYGNTLPPRQFTSLTTTHSREPGPSVTMDISQLEEPSSVGVGVDPVYGSGHYIGGVMSAGGVNRSHLIVQNGLDSSSDEGSMVVGNDDTDGNIDESFNSVLDTPSREYFEHQSPNSIHEQSFDGV